MMSKMTGWAAAVAMALLSACGGGSGAGDSVFGGGASAGSASVATLVIALTNDAGGPASTLPNNGADRVTVTVTALDANNSVVSGASLRLSVDANAQVVANGTLTDDKGQITGSVGIGADRSNRTVTVTAATANASVSTSGSFQVTGAKLTATVPPIAAPGASVAATYTLEDASANPIASQPISVSAGGAVISAGSTDADGKYAFSFTAPAVSGAYTLTAVAAGDDDVRTIQVQTTSVPPASGTPIAISVAANPSVVSVNTGAGGNSTVVRALFKGASNAAISNVRVQFVLPDPNSVGGSFSDSGVVYSDATGTATTAYIPGAISSPTDGVIVRACWSTVDFTPAAPGSKVCPATASNGSAIQTVDARLTVVDEALRLSIGTDELVGLSTGTYTKDFVVVVVDASGRAKADVEITPKLDLVGFYKGFYAWDGESWVRPASNNTLGPIGALYGAAAGECPNEDTNRNGSNDAGEDVNGNGELDPAGVTVKMLDSSRTDSSGKAIVRIEYPRDRATWIDYMITVTGRVGGSEGLAVYRGTRLGLGNLPAPGAAFKTEAVFPAFGISPYGRGAGCNNIN